MDFISFKDVCIGCNNCVNVCFSEAITITTTTLQAGTATPYHYYRASVDQSSCIECALCPKECPTGNILVNGMSYNPGGGNTEGGNTGGGNTGGGNTGGGNTGETQPPCKMMNDRSKVGSTFLEKLESLNKLLYLPIEKGFINYNGPEVNDSRFQNLFYQMDSAENGESVNSHMIKDKSAFGYLHTHRDKDGIASIHSFVDLRAYIEMVQNRISNNYTYDNTYGIVIGSEGIYSLNITDISKFTLNTMTKRELSSFWNKLYLQYDADWKNVQSTHHNETEYFMINLLAKFYDQLGISLFRYDKENNNWGLGSSKGSAPKFDNKCQ